MSRKQSPLRNRYDSPTSRQGAGRVAVEARESLEHEAQRGDSARTPLIALVVVTLGVFVIFVILLSVAMALYCLNGG